MGIRDPQILRDRLQVIGEEHLARAWERGGVILLGFHVGPPGSGLALRLLDYPVRSLHGPVGLDFSMGSGWRRIHSSLGSIPVDSGEPSHWAVALHQARQHLGAKGLLSIAADGANGAAAFRIPLPGGPLVIRSGWFVLRRHTGATTLPVLAHRDGRHRVITIHPPLPAPLIDPDEDRAACREVLALRLDSYLRQFPAQCRATLWRP